MKLRSIFAACRLGTSGPSALSTVRTRTLPKRIFNGPVPLVLQARQLHQIRSNSQASASLKTEPQTISEALPTTIHSIKIIFSDHKACDFKYIWLRDNCHCPKCIHPNSRQKLVDTASLDNNIRPMSVNVNSAGGLDVLWPEGKDETHWSVYDAEWLHKYGRTFTLQSLQSPDVNHLPAMEYWDRVSIWKQMPEISYQEVMETKSGLHSWLEMIYKYGVAIMRNVPINQDEIVKVVNRFAYVKTTIWGPTFDVICEPVQTDPSHLAYTGLPLELHTDMNYREKSPGLQLLHCLKANDPVVTGEDYGGKSFFADGFHVARWLQENHPAAFHILSSTPIKFSIKSHAMTYSQSFPVICVDNEGEIEEIHYNNRTMSPLQTQSHLVTPFYHAYRILATKMRDQSCQLAFNMLPGDLVAFNNRRVLHGRTAFDPTKVTRHLKGCYVDIDEVFTRFSAMCE